MIKILHLLFLILFFKELYITNFKNNKTKYIWLLFVFVFSYYGYSIYLAHRKRQVVKRKFNPNFTTIKKEIV